MTSLIVVTPKKTVLGRKHVVWAIQRKNQRDGSTRARNWEKKIQNDKKVTKVLYFPYMGEAPTWPIRPKSCMVGDVHDVITCVKYQIEVLSHVKVKFNLFVRYIVGYYCTYHYCLSYVCKHDIYKASSDFMFWYYWLLMRNVNFLQASRFL